MRFLATLRPSAFVAGRNSRRVESARQTLFISLVCVHCRRWAGVNRGVNKTVGFERGFLVVCRTRDSLLTYFISFFSLFCERISHWREAYIQFFHRSTNYRGLIVERKEKSWEKKNFDQFYTFNPRYHATPSSTLKRHSRFSILPLSRILEHSLLRIVNKYRNVTSNDQTDYSLYVFVPTNFESLPSRGTRNGPPLLPSLI